MVLQINKSIIYSAYVCRIQKEFYGLFCGHETNAANAVNYGKWYFRLK